MIKRFEVKNFKNFKEPLVLDFSSTHDYGFKSELIKNGLVNKMVIYGENNSGKSNLGAAIMDIVTHLSEYKNDNLLYNYYLNGDSIEDSASFTYEFIFDGTDVVYSYTKDGKRNLLYEKIIVDGRILMQYNYSNNKYENNIAQAQTIDISRRNQNMSVLKYIFNNTLFWPEHSPVKKIMDFVNNMLWFRSLKQNEFMGVMSNGEDMNDFIINNRLMKSFEAFLRSCGQDFNLCTIMESGKQVIGVRYKEKQARFDMVASTGTISLWLFFYWMNRTKNISFIYLDEFDAFYHYRLSRHILEYVNGKADFQSILTTHNTYLISNELMRPDCYVILKNGKLTSFADSTKKVIRQAHNLEKMMLGGEFGD